MPTYKLRSHNRRPKWPARKRAIAKMIRSVRAAENPQMSAEVRAQFRAIPRPAQDELGNGPMPPRSRLDDLYPYRRGL